MVISSAAKHRDCHDQTAIRLPVRRAAPVTPSACMPRSPEVPGNGRSYSGVITDVSPRRRFTARGWSFGWPIVVPVSDANRTCLPFLQQEGCLSPTTVSTLDR